MADFIPSGQSVLFVFKRDPSADEMHQGSPKRIQNFVLMRLIRDDSAIVELNPFASCDIQFNAVKMSFRRVRTIAPPPVQIVWSDLKHIRDWRMVRHLLHVYLRAIIMLALVRLAKDRIERLVEPVTRVQEAQTCCDHKLHPSYRICSESRCIQVGWTVD